MASRQLGSNAPPEDNADTGTGQVLANFLPNELDQVDSSTYNFRLYMISEEDAIAGSVFNLARQEVIAQSGVTSDVEIDEVNVSNIIGMSAEAHTGKSTKISFTLKQAAGADLLDRIYDAAARLRISNYTKMPFYLELKFRGRDPNTSLDNYSLRNRIWLWPILLAKIDIQVNAGGSTYDCTALVYDDIAYTDEYGTIDKDMSLTATSVKDYFDKVSKALTERQKQEYPNKQAKQDQWKIEFEGDIGKEKILSTKQDENPSRAGAMSDFTAQWSAIGTTVQFNDGTDILRAIDSVLGSTELIQSYVKSSLATPNMQAKEGETERDNIYKKLYRVYTSTRVIAYDPCRGDYAREFSYYVKFYDIGTIIAEQLPKDKVAENSNKKTQQFIKDKYLQKRYDYVFTGLNDQVVDFNLQYNTAWYVAKPRQAGSATQSTKNPQNSAVKPALTPEQKLEIEARDCIKENLAASGKGPQNSRGSPAISTNVGDGYQDEVGTGVEGSAGNGRNVLASLFNQVTSADMLRLDLEIKGDPFWLEPLPYDRVAYDKKVEDVIEYMSRIDKTKDYGKKGQTYILFYSRYPNAEITSGDRRDQIENQAINGIYHVLTVESKFTQGQFHQTLQCIREKSIDLSTVKSLLYRF